MDRQIGAVVLALQWCLGLRRRVVQPALMKYTINDESNVVEQAYL
jgi:hypothetical protein